MEYEAGTKVDREEGDKYIINHVFRIIINFQSFYLFVRSYNRLSIKVVCFFVRIGQLAC